MSKRKRSKSKSSVRPSARPTLPVPEQDPVLSVHPDTGDIDEAWEEVEAPPPPRPPRELMPTLTDEDPLRHDVVDSPRDEEDSSRPTLLDVDPLRHDIESED